MCYRLLVMLFFFKEETAYEMRIRDGSSDVCSSDLGAPAADGAGRSIQGVRHAGEARGQSVSPKPDDVDVIQAPFAHARAQMAGVVVGEGTVVDEERTSVGEGKSVCVRVDSCGGRINKKNKYIKILRHVK